jgi:hypothetical protein
MKFIEENLMKFIEESYKNSFDFLGKKFCFILSFSTKQSQFKKQISIIFDIPTTVKIKILWKNYVVNFNKLRIKKTITLIMMVFLKNV